MLFTNINGYIGLTFNSVAVFLAFNMQGFIKLQIKGLQLGALCPKAIVYCYFEFKRSYPKNLQLFAIRVEEFFQPIVFQRKGDGFNLF